MVAPDAARCLATEETGPRAGQRCWKARAQVNQLDTQQYMCIAVKRMSRTVHSHSILITVLCLQHCTLSPALYSVSRSFYLNYQTRSVSISRTVIIISRMPPAIFSTVAPSSVRRSMLSRTRSLRLQTSSAPWVVRCVGLDY
jgi:hypothetical protein